MQWKSTYCILLHRASNVLQKLCTVCYRGSTSAPLVVVPFLPIATHQNATQMNSLFLKLMISPTHGEYFHIVFSHYCLGSCTNNLLIRVQFMGYANSFLKHFIVLFITQDWVTDQPLYVLYWTTQCSSFHSRWLLLLRFFLPSFLPSCVYYSNLMDLAQLHTSFVFPHLNYYISFTWEWSLPVV